MKPLKYTVAALAIIAAASFTQSAKAQSAVAGDVILGAYDTAQSVNLSYEINLGYFSTLTNGETFSLGSTLGNLLSNASDAEFAAVVESGNSAGNGGLVTSEVGATELIPNGVSTNSTNQTYTTNIAALVAAYHTGTAVISSSTSSNGTSFSEVSLNDSTVGSFAKEEAANGGAFGFGAGNIDSPLTTSASSEFDLLTSGGNPVEAGTFTFSGSGTNLTLTYNAVATPEPSAYALGLCALALFWVLKRRSTVA